MVRFILLFCGLLIIGSTLFQFFGFGCSTERGITMRVTGDIHVLNKAIEHYEETNEILPRRLKDLEGSQLSELKLDPWGNDYQYDATKIVKCRVYSLGADGEVGGDGLAADMYLVTDYKCIAG